jgi:FkbM family methyltransferase
MSTVVEECKRKIQRLIAGQDTPIEFLLLCFDFAAKIVARKNFRYHLKPAAMRLREKHLKGDVYAFKDAYLPLLDLEDELLFASTYEDVLLTYIEHKDSYHELNMAPYYDLLPEGTYCFENGIVNVNIEEGDIVFDVGSWIGEFAAYASAKGATCYAFEPSFVFDKYLKKTSKLNKRIYPIKKGLSNKKTTLVFDNQLDDSGASHILQSRAEQSRAEQIEVTTIDDFVRENNLKRVDFIKSDIEGHERFMLEGAMETMRNYAPKLAICTYHLPDDPVVLSKIIKDANPAYSIVQKRKKLYASVNK